MTELSKEVIEVRQSIAELTSEVGDIQQSWKLEITNEMANLTNAVTEVRHSNAELVNEVTELTSEMTELITEKPDLQRSNL